LSGQYRPAEYLQDWLRYLKIDYEISGDRDALLSPKSMSEFTLFAVIKDEYGRLKSQRVILASSLEDDDSVLHFCPELPTDQIKEMEAYLKKMDRTKRRDKSFFKTADLRYHEIPFNSLRTNVSQSL
jgi:hypothetical protein